MVVTDVNDDAIRDQMKISNGRWQVSHWDILQPLDGQLNTFDMVLDKGCLDALIMLRLNAKKGLENQIDLLRVEDGIYINISIKPKRTARLLRPFAHQRKRKRDAALPVCMIYANLENYVVKRTTKRPGRAGKKGTPVTCAVSVMGRFAKSPLKDPISDRPYDCITDEYFVGQLTDSDF